MTDEQPIEKTELELCQETLRQAQDKTHEHLNNWKRAEADFVNYKKDENKRIENAIQFGNERIILETLDAVDNLEMAYHNAPKDTDAGWLDGLKQVLKQFSELLHKHNVQRIATVGEKFDPLHHEALQQVQGKPGEEEIVVQEVRAGYTMHGKVIRPARVTINK